jgi:excisionase family DNA binding protein
LIVIDMRNVMTLQVQAPRSARPTASRSPVRAKTYTVAEAANLLGISRSHAYVCVKTGELPSLRFRRRIVIPAHAIENMLAFPEPSQR